MFPAGTRVYVCSSAIIGKKFGPKRHSLGFISGRDGASLVKFVKNFPLKNQSFVLIPLKIVFTRYGKEEKSRCESREFIQILPVFSNIQDPTIVINRTKKIISTFDDGDLAKNPGWNDVVRHYTKGSRNIGTVIPIDCEGAALMNENETKAWVNSILHDSNFRNIISINRGLPTLRKLAGHPDLLIWVSNAVRKSKARQDLLLWAADDPENMERLVILLRGINTAFSKRMLTNTETEPKYSNQINSFLTWLTYGAFGNEGNIKKKGDVIGKINGAAAAPSLRGYTENLAPTLSTYLNFKPKYV